MREQRRVDDGVRMEAERRTKALMKEIAGNVVLSELCVNPLLSLRPEVYACRPRVKLHLVPSRFMLAPNPQLHPTCFNWEGTYGSRAAPTGYVTPNFAPTQIIEGGLKMAVGTGLSSKYSSAVYLDSIDW